MGLGRSKSKQNCTLYGGPIENTDPLAPGFFSSGKKLCNPTAVCLVTLIFLLRIGSYFKQTKSIKQAQSICQAATTFLSCIHPPISIPVVFVLGSDSPAPFLTHAAPCPDHLDVPFLNEYPCLSFSPPLFPRSFSLPSVLLLARRSSVSSTHCNKQRACTYAYAAAFIHPRTPQHTASSIATPPLH